MVEAFFGPGGPACTTGADRSCGAPTAEDIVLQQLSDSQWRVVDRRLPDNDACSLLGFIEEKIDGKGRRFEVMHLGQGFQWFTFPSLADAVNRFSALADNAAGREPEMRGLQIERK